jgi:hypothetical protein
MVSATDPHGRNLGFAEYIGVTGHLKGHFISFEIRIK